MGQLSTTPLRKSLSQLTLSKSLLLLTTVLGSAAPAPAQPHQVRNAAGVTMSVDPSSTDPALRVTIPDGPPDTRSFTILFPEHLTLRAHGQTDATHLYIYSPGTKGTAPHWNKTGNTLEYAADFGDIHFAAHATLMSDGILFRYDFTNHSAIDYDMATAITDPRFQGAFYDPRLQRTYVHTKDGFKLLASETPERLTMPLNTWLPVRYHASYSIPIPAQRVQHRDDGITYRYMSQRVDVPLIAIVSKDRTWIAASYSRDPGNVWTNPELTCLHTDPQVPLPRASHAQAEVKLLLFKGTLEDAFEKIKQQ